jgi:glyoxylase I family protein
VGPTDHGFVKSIYFFDPNGHRLELTTDTSKPGMMEKLAGVAGAMLEEWSKTKKPVRHAAWAHEAEFAKN